LLNITLLKEKACGSYDADYYAKIKHVVVTTLINVLKETCGSYDADYYAKRNMW